MPPVIIKNDPALERIRKVLKNLKEQIMEYANLKLKIWEEGRKVIVRRLK